MKNNKDSIDKHSDINSLVKRDNALSILNQAKQSCNKQCQEQKKMIKKLLTYIKERQTETTDHYTTLLSNEEVRRLLKEYSL
jgi:predicted solute-binding protein